MHWVRIPVHVYQAEFVTTRVVLVVVDAAPTRKKSRAGLNVFHYAGTVEEAEWNDEKQKKELEVRGCWWFGCSAAQFLLGA